MTKAPKPFNHFVITPKIATGKDSFWLHNPPREGFTEYCRQKFEEYAELAITRQRKGPTVSPVSPSGR